MSNWQADYITMLKNFFKNYTGCHFIIATHSHYLVSDLEKNSSSLIILRQNNIDSSTSSELIKYSTYAWSAENVLYNVFKTRTTRNFYFEADLLNLIKKIEQKTQDVIELRNLMNKLSNYVLDKNDPLQELLAEAERYIIDVEN